MGMKTIWQGEALHGLLGYGRTSFPQVLGLASTWDPELVLQAFSAAADETAFAGVRQAFTPVLDLARDPRWGRTEETYGEDPYLVAHMGVAAIDGLQGTSWMIDGHHVMATMKHFAAHGQPESGTNAAPANFSERDLRETFLVPFRAAVQEAHVGSAMASYNEIDAIPSHINRWLLDRVLRQEWGFRGYVTSDGGGLQMLVETHHVAADFAEAARKALAAGVDFDLSDGSVYATLVDQVREGKVPEAELDQAVQRVLDAEGCKITTGKQGWAAWYENKVTQPDPKAEVETIRAASAVARQADVAIVVVGENESTNREAWSEQHLGDRDSLDLLGSQEALIRAVVETGKPTIVFLINGRPLSINYVK